MTTSFDSHHHHQHTLYSNRTYASTTTATTNRSFHPYLTTLPLPPINICENLLYDVAIGGCGEIGSATSSSYINSSEHYDNTYINTYDNPIQYLENFSSKSVDIVHGSRNDLRHNDEDNLYDTAKGIEIDDDDNEHSSSSTPRSTSPVLFYLENKSLAVCACIISLLLLLLIGLCIFLLNKLIRPVIINTTVNNHYSMSNLTNTTVIPTTFASRSTTTTTSPVLMLLRRASIHMPITASTTLSIPSPDDLPFPYSSCAPDRWGIECENVCKPCGLGVCHPATGKCVCPTGIYGQFCDLWQVNDKPKRGDMTTS